MAKKCKRIPAKERAEKRKEAKLRMVFNQLESERTRLEILFRKFHLSYCDPFHDKYQWNRRFRNISSLQDWYPVLDNVGEVELLHLETRRLRNILFWKF